MSLKRKNTLPEKIHDSLAQIWEKTIIVACSWGVDSMVLLDLLRKSKVHNEKCKMQNEGLSENSNKAPLSRGDACKAGGFDEWNNPPIEVWITPPLDRGAMSNELWAFSFSLWATHIVVAHVHHWLRDSATRDEKIVENYCNQHGLIFEVLHIDVKKEAKKTKTTVEECARNIRKKWFEELRVKYEAKFILTAHHADDQAETLLYRIVKGTSITGLVWIEKETGYFLRPLLEIKKSEILDYAKSENLVFGHDETNDDTTIPRNLLRHEILPKLATINPEYAHALDRLSDSARELKEGFNEFFEKEFATCPLEKGGQGGLWKYVFPLDKYTSLPKWFQHELLRFLYEKANGSTHGFSKALIDELDRFLSTRNGGKKEIKNMKLLKKSGSVLLTT